MKPDYRFVTGALHMAPQDHRQYQTWWPKDGLVYVIGSLFDSSVPLIDCERLLASLPGRKILVYDPTDDWAVSQATLPGWLSVHEEPIHLTTWGRAVCLSTKPVEGVLTYHTQEGTPDSSAAINISWGSWSTGPADKTPWAAFLPLYYLSILAANMIDDFVAPV